MDALFTTETALVATPDFVSPPTFGTKHDLGFTLHGPEYQSLRRRMFAIGQALEPHTLTDDVIMAC